MKISHWISTAGAAGALALTACGATPDDQTWIDDADFSEAGALPDEPEPAPVSAEPLDDATNPSIESELGTSQQALGNNCTNVNIRIENSYHFESERDILVRYVKFFNADKGNGEWQTELLPNEQINYGSTDSWVQNLEGAEGDTITRWRVYFSYSTGNEWSSTYYREINTSDRNCFDGMNVELTVD